MGIGAHSNITMYRPEDVFRFGSVSQQDCCATVDGKVTYDLRDSHGICVDPTIEGDYTVNGDSDDTSPLVYSRR